MRKLSYTAASQDGGDNTSITSGFENELKKPGKSKRNSIKKRIQSFSHESDDAVIEPLLQKEKDKSEVSNQSAKLLLPKTKTDSASEGNDTDKLLADSEMDKPSMTKIPSITGNIQICNGIKEISNGNIQDSSKITTSLLNHMNTNIFTGNDNLKNIKFNKNPLLVEFDGNKHSSYSPSPCIFTTAKIHFEGQSKPIQSNQVTSVPITSAIEGTVVKTTNITDADKNKPSFSTKDNNSKQVNSPKDNVSFNMGSTNNRPSCSLTDNKQKEENISINSRTLSTDKSISKYSIEAINQGSSGPDSILKSERAMDNNKNITPATTISENIKDGEDTVNIKNDSVHLRDSTNISTTDVNSCNIPISCRNDSKIQEPNHTAHSKESDRKITAQTSCNNELPIIVSVASISDNRNTNKLNEPKIIILETSLDSKKHSKILTNACSNTPTIDKISVISSTTAKTSTSAIENSSKIKTSSIESKSTIINTSESNKKDPLKISNSDSVGSKLGTTKVFNKSTVKAENSGKSKTEIISSSKVPPKSMTTSRISTVSTMKPTVTSVRQATISSAKLITSTAGPQTSTEKNSTVTTMKKPSFSYMKPSCTKTMTLGSAKSNSAKSVASSTPTSSSVKTTEDEKLPSKNFDINKS